MKIDSLLEKMDEAIEYCQLNEIADCCGELLKLVNQDEACRLMAERLNRNYTTHREGATAKMMETVIRVKPAIGMVAFPDNYFFQLALLRGSMELYECYIEEVMEVIFAKKSAETKADRYVELYSRADSYANEMLPKYKRVIKGVHFNGAFSEHSDTAVVINSEDYWLMDDVVERYNAIVGRRDILEDLLRRVELE